MEILRIISKFILFTFIIIGQPTGIVLAQDFRVEVVVDQLNVRPEPPSAKSHFGWSRYLR
jgi:hypothetical protein